MRARKSVRTVVALVSASMLLAGCGSGGAGQPLTRAEADAVLPGDQAMAGWKVSVPATTKSKRSAYEAVLCPGKTAEACEGVRSYGVAQYRHEEKSLETDFQVVSYDDAGSAEAAYDELWEWRGELGNPRTVDLGDGGEERDARVGRGAAGEGKRAVYAARVGPLILIGYVTLHDAEAQLGDATIKSVAAMFTERADQAVGGEKPSAGLAVP